MLTRNFPTVIMAEYVGEFDTGKKYVETFIDIWTEVLLEVKNLGKYKWTMPSAWNTLQIVCCLPIILWNIMKCVWTIPKKLIRLFGSIICAVGKSVAYLIEIIRSPLRNYLNKNEGYSYYFIFVLLLVPNVCCFLVAFSGQLLVVIGKVIQNPLAIISIVVGTFLTIIGHLIRNHSSNCKCCHSNCKCSHCKCWTNFFHIQKKCCCAFGTLVIYFGILIQCTAMILDNPFQFIEYLVLHQNLSYTLSNSSWTESVPFLPSIHGFSFPNGESDIPISICTLRTSYEKFSGLCGGMIFSAKDHQIEGRNAGMVNVTRENKQMVTYLFNRLLDSWNLLGFNRTLPGRLFDYMAIEFTDIDRLNMMNSEFYFVKKDIDNGLLAPIVLVGCQTIYCTANFINDISKNHQVAVYDYKLEGDNILMKIYEDNNPNDNSVILRFNRKNYNVFYYCEYKEEIFKVYTFFYNSSYTFKKLIDFCK